MKDTKRTVRDRKQEQKKKQKQNQRKMKNNKKKNSVHLGKFIRMKMIITAENYLLIR